MKKMLIIVFMSVYTLFFSGCASNQSVLEKNEKYNIIKDNNSIILEINAYKMGEKEILENLFLYTASYSLKNNFSDFILLKENLNQAVGFPINTYKDLKDYCIKKDRSKNLESLSSAGCPIIANNGTNYKSIKFILINNPSYEITSFNAKDVLEEIKSEK